MKKIIRNSIGIGFIISFISLYIFLILDIDPDSIYVKMSFSGIIVFGGVSIGYEWIRSLK